MIKYFPTFLLTMSISGLAVLGIFAMNHAGGHASGKCFAAVAEKSLPCPGSADPVNSANFHINAFAKIFEAIFSQSPLGAFFALLLLLSAGIFLRRAADTANLRFTYTRGTRKFVAPAKLILISWLSLLEKRDPGFYPAGA